jgi:hypothetical protein
LPRWKISTVVAVIRVSVWSAPPSLTLTDMREW